MIYFAKTFNKFRDLYVICSHSSHCLAPVPTFFPRSVVLLFCDPSSSSFTLSSLVRLGIHGQSATTTQPSIIVIIIIIQPTTTVTWIPRHSHTLAPPFMFDCGTGCADCDASEVFHSVGIGAALCCSSLGDSPSRCNATQTTSSRPSSKVQEDDEVVTDRRVAAAPSSSC